MKTSVKIAIVVFGATAAVAILVHHLGASPFIGAALILFASGVYAFQKLINE
jgi:hypothetical protein